MSDQRERRERSHLQHEAEHSRPPKKGSVVTYLAILFGAAFLLLLLSYFMQQRSAEQTISGLKDSVNSFQNVETLLEANTRLSTENDTLKEQVDSLSDQVDALIRSEAAAESIAETQEKQLQAMDWLWRIQRAYSRGNISDAKKIAQQFEAQGLPPSLPRTSLSGAEGATPAEQYAALLDAMGIQTIVP